MRKWIAVAMVFLAGMVLFSCSKPEVGEKKAVLVVSFGTSYPETRTTTIGAIEQEMGAVFQGWDIERAFTSETIRRIIKTREGVEILGPGEMLDKLARERYTTVLVQPTHILQGAEYNELLEKVAEKTPLFKDFKVGKPLLSDEDDYAKTADALIEQFPEGETVVLMGHGNEHYPSYNSAYGKLQKVFDDRKMPVHIGLVEGDPDLDSVIKRLASSGAQEVVLMPFMIVAGDHANNDMASDEEDSWKTLLAEAGVQSRVYLHGIGENESIRKIYVEHAMDAL